MPRHLQGEVIPYQSSNTKLTAEKDGRKIGENGKENGKETGPAHQAALPPLP
jgi:hypothetical protein